MLTLLIVGYFVAGTVWGVLKWVFFVLDHKRGYLAAKAAGKTTYRFQNSKGGIVPLVGEHKSRILGWMVFWPLNVLWTIFYKWVKRVFKHIRNAVLGALQGFADRVMKDVK